MENELHNSSVDPREVEHFKALAETWWDKTGPFWPLHSLNALRLEWIKERLHQAGLTSGGERPLTGLRVIDIGCGGGILSESLAKLGAEVTGIDIVERNLSIARAHAGKASLNIDYRLATAEDEAARGATYDVAFNMEVVEHVADLNSFMAACNSMVRPGGIMFVASINRNWLAWLIAVLGAEYILQWLPRGTHHYHKLRKPTEIRKCLARDALTVEDFAGVKVNPFTRKMSIVQHTLVNYMLSAKRAVAAGL